jgi:hypothetical protein
VKKFLLCYDLSIRGDGIHFRHSFFDTPKLTEAALLSAEKQILERTTDAVTLVWRSITPLEG